MPFFRSRLKRVPCLRNPTLTLGHECMYIQSRAMQGGLFFALSLACPIYYWQETERWSLTCDATTRVRGMKGSLSCAFRMCLADVTGRRKWRCRWQRGPSVRAPVRSGDTGNLDRPESNLEQGSAASPGSPPIGFPGCTVIMPKRTVSSVLPYYLKLKESPLDTFLLSSHLCSPG
jgi:hypothetical protein